jgi:hypothetical protein
MWSSSIMTRSTSRICAAVTVGIIGSFGAAAHPLAVRKNLARTRRSKPSAQWLVDVAKNAGGSPGTPPHGCVRADRGELALLPIEVVDKEPSVLARVTQFETAQGGLSAVSL